MGSRGGGGGGMGGLPQSHSRRLMALSNKPPLCDIWSGCCFFTGPWTVIRSSPRVPRRVTVY